MTNSVFCSLGRDQLAAKVGISGPKTTAAVRFFGVKDDPECFKEIVIGKARFGRYSQKAIERLKEKLAKTSIDEIWKRAAAPKS